MAERHLQALVVTGGEQPNTLRAWLCNGLDIHGGVVVKPAGQPATLIVSSMEVEEAKKSGLPVLTLDAFNYADILLQVEGDRAHAQTVLWGKFIEHFAIPPGKIGVYGTGDIHVWIERARLLAAHYPQHPCVGENGMTLFDVAMRTKDADEIAIIRQVAAQTNAVLQATWDFIAGHRAEGESVVKADGSALTVGDVKRFIRRALLDHELECPSMIFAQGREAGFPHSRGEAGDPLKLGQPIVFDLFPQPLGGGYCHDVTRTWSIGYARPDVQGLYDQVMTAFERAVAAFEEAGQPAHTLQEAALECLEGYGHPTQRSHPGTQVGYVHSLGHGIGLNIHERPAMHHLMKEDVLEAGNVITIEPGLYYPEQGIGVRVEDSFLVDAAGGLVSISPFKKDLVLPLHG
jgi:Xaa-Pro aminopeptidase